VAVELIVGAAVGAGVFAWRFRRTLRRRKQFVSALHEVRDAQGHVTYRPATAADSELLAVFGADQTVIEACGFAVLGDIVREVGDRRLAIMRAFCDRSQTTCAVATVAVKTPSKSWTLYSFADDQMFSTHRGVPGTLATPPFVHRQPVAADLPYAQVVDRHRTFATASPLVHIASRDALLAELERLHAKIASWRDAQPPDELLDADLKGVLGNVGYAWSGKAWTRRLRGRLPVATLRRR
jgi:hypothetical protein